jgi:hypothetical protein
MQTTHDIEIKILNHPLAKQQGKQPLRSFERVYRSFVGKVGNEHTRSSILEDLFAKGGQRMSPHLSQSMAAVVENVNSSS